MDCCTPTSTPLQLFDCTAEWKLLLHFYTSIHSPFETWFNIGVKTENKLKTKSFTMKIDMHISGNPGLGTACDIIYSSNPGTGVQPLGVPFNTPLQLAFHTPFSGVQPQSSIPKWPGVLEWCTPWSANPNTLPPNPWWNLTTQSIRRSYLVKSTQTGRGAASLPFACASFYITEMELSVICCSLP